MSERLKFATAVVYAEDVPATVAFYRHVSGLELSATFRQPFDLLAITNTTWERKEAARVNPAAFFNSWLRR